MWKGGRTGSEFYLQRKQAALSASHSPARSVTQVCDFSIKLNERPNSVHHTRKKQTRVPRRGTGEIHTRNRSAVSLLY